MKKVCWILLLVSIFVGSGLMAQSKPGPDQNTAPAAKTNVATPPAEKANVAAPPTAQPAARPAAAARPATKNKVAAQPPAASTAAAAPAPAPTAAGSDKPHALTVKQILTQGGDIMHVIVGLSLVAVGLIIFYLLTLRPALIFPKHFIMEAQDAAETGDLELLRELCQENASPAAMIINAALEQCVDGQPLDYNTARDAMEDEGARQASFLWQRIQYLLDVSVISPMVGLLGTVWGMMVSFSGLESGVSIINKADALASGVAQAMYTTFGGLIVAIFSMTAYAMFRGRINRLIGALEGTCNGVLRRLAQGRKFTTH